MVTGAAVAAPRVQALPGCWSDGTKDVRPGPVAGALVRSLDATPSPPPATPLVLEERGCHLSPEVAGLVEGQGLLLRAADQQRHAWTVRRGGQALFRVVQPAGAPAPAHGVPPGAEPVEVTCAEHPSARAFIFVRPNDQFTATDAAGRFTLRGLRAGLRTFEVWHPLLAPVRQTVELPAEGVRDVEFRLPVRR